MSNYIEQAMRDGYIITYNHPVTYLTDEANEEHQWSVERSIAPFSVRSALHPYHDERHWNGATIQEALDKAKAALQPLFDRQQIQAG